MILYLLLNYNFKFLLPREFNVFYATNTFFYSQKIKAAVLKKIKVSDLNDIGRYNIKKKYIDEWDSPKSTLQLHANNRAGEIGFISFLFCASCIWAIYPYEKNYARVKVMGSAEAQNKFCEFIHSFSDNGD